MSGVLVLDPRGRSFSGGIAHIVVEDARRAGAPAIPIADTQIIDVTHREGEAERIVFALESDDAPAGQGWSVRASIGDQYSTERVQAGTALTLRLTAMEAGA